MRWLRRVWNAFLPILAFAVLIALWQLWVVWAGVPAFLLPAPTVIVRALIDGWPDPLAYDTWVTLQETLGGFALGCVLGFLLAIGITYSRFLERVLYPPIVASQAVPKLAIAPLFVIWLGFGILPKIIITMTLVFFPIVVTTAQGLMSVDANLIELLRSVNARPWQVFWKVRLPHALPAIISGMKIGITLAVIGAVVGEWVGAGAGLGYRVLFAQSQLQTPVTYAAILILITLGVGLFALLDAAGRLAAPWSDAADRINVTM
ncbi:MAG: ABC transporter permease [Burkholderiales bacterium]|nr:ABC transporter permease [Burkholderiales bacterium]